MDVGSVEKGGLLQPDVHERRLHAREHASDAPLVNVADATFFLVAFDEKLGKAVVFHDGDARFLGGCVYQDPSHGSDGCGLG